MLEFSNNLCGEEPSRNRVVVPARQATQPGGIGSLESILAKNRLQGTNSTRILEEFLGLLKSLKIWAQVELTRHREI